MPLSVCAVWNGPPRYKKQVATLDLMAASQYMSENGPTVQKSDARCPIPRRMEMIVLESARLPITGMNLVSG